MINSLVRSSYKPIRSHDAGTRPPELRTLQPPPGPPWRLVEFLADQGSMIRDLALRDGSVLLRGFAMNGTADFAEAVRHVGGPLARRYEGPSPRHSLRPDVYTASDVSSIVVVPEHAEMSYEAKLPRHLFFHCHVPSWSGGETTFVDSRRVYAELDPAVRNLLTAAPLRIRRRHAPPRGGSDPFELEPWNRTYGTEEREAVLGRARAAGYRAHFGDDDTLTLEHEQPAVRLHPVTREPCFANHLLVFHRSTPTAVLGSAVRSEKSLRSAALYPLAAAYRSLGTRFGHEVATDVRLANGAPVPDDAVAHVRSVVDRLAIWHRWQPGDVVVVDNHASLHGRRPYLGPRSVAVAFTEARA